MSRDTGASRVCNFLPYMQLPSRDVVLKVTKNKEHVIELTVYKIKINIVKIRIKITVTGKDPIPFKVINGCIEEPIDLKTNQEESNTILIHQVAAMGPGKVVVISDDTDVFVLPLHYISTGDIKVNVLMQLTSADSDKVMDITATYHKYISFTPNTLAAHTLSGCDTVDSCYVIGKPTVIKALKNNTMSFPSIGELNSSVQLTEGANLLLSC